MLSREAGGALSKGGKATGRWLSSFNNDTSVGSYWSRIHTEGYLAFTCGGHVLNETVTPWEHGHAHRYTTVTSWTVPHPARDAELAHLKKENTWQVKKLRVLDRLTKGSFSHVNSYLLWYRYPSVYLGMFKGNLRLPLALLCHSWNLIFCLSVIYVGSKKLSDKFFLRKGGSRPGLNALISIAFIEESDMGKVLAWWSEHPQAHRLWVPLWVGC